ncbi:MAG: nucleoside kinase [Lachnospiraceae bacterium]|nr:nucleoside kinase [Lachnospiraceae bacterium]
MTDTMIRVTIDGSEKVFPSGLTYGEILRSLSGDEKYPVVLVRANGQLRELFQRAENDCVLDTVSAAEASGFRTYRRSMCLLLLTAIKNTSGAKAAGETILHHSMGSGYYFVPGNGVKADAAFLEKTAAEMKRLVAEKLPFRKYSMSVAEARKYFKANYMEKKANLFRYRTASLINVYELDGFTDYFYGYMMEDTSSLGVFELIPYSEGFILQMPDGPDLKSLPAFNPSPKVFNTQLETLRWGQMLGINTVSDLNDTICQGSVTDTLLYAEALQEGKISEIAEQIAAKGTVKFVLIAGPSSSGKTTFSRRISVQLRAKGLRPHPISLDDYYVNREDTPLDENGEYDFECLEAIDIKKFNEDMESLLEGKEVELPVFNFKTGHREYKGDFLQLKDGDVLVLEGIHGLNDKLTFMLPDESKFRIYISALTQLNIDNHNRIPTTDGRLIRRMVRDYRTRGTSAASTIARWPSVRRGEEKNIFPYQEKADAVFNTALIYELAVLKLSAVPFLYQIPEDAPEHEEAKRLLKFLDYFVAIPTEAIPNNSILREFVGGGCFRL